MSEHMEDIYAHDAVRIIGITASEALVYPMSGILTRIQAAYTNPLAIQQPYSLLSGMSSIISAAPAFILRLKLCEYLHTPVKSSLNLSTLQTFTLVSGIGDLIGCLLRNPTEVWRQQCQAGHYTSFRLFYTDILGHWGVFGFWRGLAPFFLRDTLFNSMRFGLITYLEHRATQRPEYKRSIQRNTLNPDVKKQLSAQLRNYTWMNMLATIPAAVLTTPFDVIKTRMMTYPMHEGKVGPIECAKTILREEGMGVLFRGAGLRTLYMACVMSIFLVIEQSLMRNLEDTRRIAKSNADRDLFRD